MNLVREFASRENLQIDLLLIRAQGPHLENVPSNINVIQLRASHTLTSIPELIRYFRRSRPKAMLVAKDRAGRAALIANRLTGSMTKVVIRLGTNLSTALAHRAALNRWLRTMPMRLLYPMAERVVAVSEGVRQDTLAITGIDASRVQVIRNPVVTSQMLKQSMEACPHPWLDDDQVPVVMGVGRLSKQKDFVTLIKAFALLREHRPARLIILGDGQDRAQLEKLIEELRLVDVVLLPGFDINPYKWVARADLFVLSSRWEGSPNALTEALALGVPSVSTRCPSGPNETLQEGEYGPLVEVGDYRGLAKAMEQVLNKPLPAERLKQAVAEYRPSISANRYLQVLEGERCVE